MYDTGEALLASIIANPDDNGVKLAYADWLDEHDHAERAKRIRDMINGRRPRGHRPGRHFPDLPDSIVVHYIFGEYPGPTGCTTPCAWVQDGFIVELAVTWAQFRRFGAVVCKTNPIRHVHLCRTYSGYEPRPEGGGYWEWEDLPPELVDLVPPRWEGARTRECKMQGRVAMSDLLIRLARDDFRGLPVRSRRSNMPAYSCNVCGRTIRGRHVQTISEGWLAAGGFGRVPPNAIVHICRQCERESPEFGGQD
jgi:uncharacterized protein (TIGR02996 family)